MGWLLDTNHWIALLKRRCPLLAAKLAASQHSVPLPHQDRPAVTVQPPAEKFRRATTRVSWKEREFP